MRFISFVQQPDAAGSEGLNDYASPFWLDHPGAREQVRVLNLFDAALRLRNRSTPSKRVRYILAKIEKQLSGGDITDEGITATVEHIRPENSGEVGWEHFTPKAHERGFLSSIELKTL